MPIPSPQPADPLDLARRKAEIGRRLFGTQAPATTRVGRYAVLRSVGAGGMATVYVAYDESLDRRVALKVLKGDRTPARDEQLAAEGRAMARLSHPNVATIYEIAEAVVPELGETPLQFIAIEFVDGENLRRWSRSPRTLDEKVEVLTAAGRGLAAAHGHGIVHRDFKPENVMIGASGDVKVVDFGVAGWIDSIHITDDDTGEGEGEDGSARTPGGMPGTPAYMAPEQRAGVRADAASDQFSFCLTALELLGGRHPFEGASIDALLDGSGLPIAIPDEIPRQLARILQRGLSVDPAERFPDMDALLRAWTHDARRPWLFVGMGVALAAGVGGIAYGAMASARPEPCTDSAARLEEAWNPTRKAALATGFSATALPHAAESWGHIERQLDRWGQDWTAARDGACAATRVHGTQSEDLLDRRMACLDRGWASFRALIDTLAEPDADVVARGPTASEQLFPLSTGSDPTALASALPLPTDPAARQELADVEADTATLRSEVRIRSTEAMRATATRLVERADATGFPPASARARLVAAIVERGLGHEPESLAILERALVEAEAAGDARTFAEIRIALGRQLAGARDEHDRALFMLDVAEGALRRAHDPIELRASLELGRGHVFERIGRDIEAVEAFDRALEWLAREPEAHDEARAGATTARALVTAGAGDIDRAVADIQDHRALLERQHGPTHPLVCRTLGYLAVIHLRSGRWKQASAELEQELTCLESTLGADHIALEKNLSNQARALMNLGRLDEAERVAERHLALLETHRGPDSAGSADAYATLARIHQSHGELDEAHQAFTRAIAVVESNAAGSPLHLADHLVARADVSVHQGDLEAARKDAERILALVPELGINGTRTAAGANMMLGKLARDEKDYAAASAHFEAALASFEAFHQGAPNLDVVIALDYIAGLHRLRDDHEAALAVTEREWSMLEALEGTVPVIEANVALKLAQDLWRTPSDRVRADALAARAERTYAEIEDPNVEKVRAWRRTHHLPPRR